MAHDWLAALSRLQHPPPTHTQGSMEGWAEFMQEMQSFYQVDLDCLSEPFRREQREYYLQTAQVGGRGGRTEER
jgi:hypothetical protein